MTGQVIAFAQEKGGSGKSTTLALLAAVLVRDGKSVCILDVDPQKTAHDWAKASVERHGLQLDYGVIDLAEQAKITPVLKNLRDQYDLVLVDTAGIEAQSLFAVIMRSDLVLIPSKASLPDMLGLVRTYGKVKECDEVADQQTATFAVLCDVDPKTNMTAQISAELKSSEIPQLPQPLYHRTKIKEFLANGGYPEGKALEEARKLLAMLQLEGVLDCYASKKEQAHG